MPPGSRCGASKRANSGPNAATRSPWRSASTWSCESERASAGASLGQSAGFCPSSLSRSNLVWTMPCPAASASAVKKPATPFCIESIGSPPTVPSKRKRNSQLSPWRKNSST